MAASPDPLGRPPSDGPPAPGRLASLRLAVAFLTVLPVALRTEASPVGSAAGWFPLVGGMIGGLAGGVDYLSEPSLGPGVAAILAAGVLVGLGGGLHEDGLADCADGLGARDRERRLAIMRDSSIGTFGAVALIVWLMLVVAALARLDRVDGLCALVVASAVGRWAALVHASTAPAARPDGLGAGFRVSPGGLALASAFAVVIGGAVLGPIRGVTAIAVAAAVGLLVSVWSGRALGGRTGDTIGACVALAEVAVLLTLVGVGVR